MINVFLLGTSLSSDWAVCIFSFLVKVPSHLLPFQFPFKGKIFESNPERGDVIVFKLPGQENINYVKRLIGLPGETIKVINGEVYIKSNNSKEFEMLNQFDDGFFFDDQYKKDIQQLIDLYLILMVVIQLMKFP